MNKIKNYLKFLLKKGYREYLWQLETEGCIERVRESKTKTNNKFMLLLRKNREVGFFSDYIVFLREIEYARQKGYIPIVDRKSIKNIFLPADHNINTWEIFFEQPLGYTVENAYQMEGELCINHIPSKIEAISLMHCDDENIVNYWRMIARNYIRFKDNILQYLENQKKLLLGEKRVLGISVREGYTKLSETEPEKIGGHPRQAGIEQLLDNVRCCSEEWNCKYIFLTCQTKDTVRRFKSEFSERLIYVERDRKSYDELSEGSEINIKSYRDGYKNELEYITEIYLLSKCTCFICSENSGSEAAYIMSEGYEKFKCIECGTY